MSDDAPCPGSVLVTGAAKRIGRSIALDFARQGWSVAVHYRESASEADVTAAEMAAWDVPVTLLAADLGREDEAQALVPRAVEALGPLTCLINSASTFDMDEVHTATRESWDLHMEVNLRAPFVLSQAFAAQLPDGKQGNIVNMLDQRVWNPTPYFMSYTVSKAGLWTLTRTLALALAPRVRVNAIGPGPTLPSKHQSDAQFERQTRRMPLRRGTTPEEICDAVRFVLAAPAMTGQMIALDGGQHLGWAQPVDADAADD
jgi:NAD(P)-dependent dehydrogenase (short-subunit alcohol dehydrogenase family)